jgi:hypothetical protein
MKSHRTLHRRYGHSRPKWRKKYGVGEWEVRNLRVVAQVAGDDHVVQLCDVALSDRSDPEAKRMRRACEDKIVDKRFGLYKPGHGG